MVGKEAKVFTNADIADLEKKHRSKVAEASLLMQKAREWLKGENLVGPKYCRALGDFDVRLVIKVMGIDKRIKNRVQYASLEEIGDRFAADIKAVMTKEEWALVDAYCPWNVPKDTTVVDPEHLRGPSPAHVHL